MRAKFIGLKLESYEANMQLNELDFVVYTFGNVSAVYRKNGVFAIRPTGVAYKVLKPEHIMIVDFNNNIVEGSLHPSSDKKTLDYLYKNWENIRGIAHTHATCSLTCPQSQLDIPIFGTTQADHLTADIPSAPPKCDDLVEGNYEHSTGIQIIDYFKEKKLSHKEVEMILLGYYSPFVWGDSAAKAVYKNKILEVVAERAYLTLQINSNAPRLKDSLIKKHDNR